MQIIFLAIPVYFSMEMAGNWCRIKVELMGKDMRYNKVKIRIYSSPGLEGMREKRERNMIFILRNAHNEKS